MLFDNAINLQAEVFRTVMDFEEVPVLSIKSVVPSASTAPIFVASEVLETAPSPEAIVAVSLNESLIDTPKHALGKETDDIAIGIGVEENGDGGASHQLVVLYQDRGLKDGARISRILDKAKGEARAIYTGRVRATPTWHRDHCNPIRIGCSVGHKKITAGTLGCFAANRNTEELGILSNNHVLANVNNASPGDEIWQPGKADGGNSGDVIARLRRFSTIKFGGMPNRLDCAWAELENSGRQFEMRRRIDSARVEVGDLSATTSKNVFPGLDVLKIGRTTGYTQGRVLAVNVNNLTINMGAGRFARFDGQISFESHNKNKFSDGGDSGSVIVNTHFEPIALLFAGSKLGGAYNVGVTFGNPIDEVLSHLDIDIVI